LRAHPAQHAAHGRTVPAHQLPKGAPFAGRRKAAELYVVLAGEP
jgi:hypothetical protein